MEVKESDCGVRLSPLSFFRNGNRFQKPSGSSGSWELLFRDRSSPIGSGRGSGLRNNAGQAWFRMDHCKSARCMFAEDIYAPVRLASESRAFRRSALKRLAPWRSELLRSVPLRSASLKSTVRRSRLLRSTFFRIDFWKVHPRNSALLKFTPRQWVSLRLAFFKSQPAKNVLLRFAPCRQAPLRLAP